MAVRITGLDELIRDLEAIPEKAPPKFRKVMSKGALNIKMEWRRRWLPRIGGGAQNLPHIVRGIGYDTHERRSGTYFEAEIGVAATNPQAPLAHFAEFGTPFPPTPPHPGGLPALEEEEPRYVQAVADVAVELLEGR